MGATFHQDLSDSHQRELSFAYALEQTGATTTTATPGILFSDWDVRATWPEKNLTITFEVKLDRFVHSPYVAIEVGRMEPGNLIPKPSGITATKAQFYCYTFKGDDNFYIISTPILMQWYTTCEWERRIACGDNDESLNILVKKKKFIAACKILKK